MTNRQVPFEKLTYPDYHRPGATFYERFGKRILDVTVAGAALVALSPLCAMVAILIRAEDGGPIIFRQKRVGRNGRLFTFLKFRSMPVNTPDLASKEARQLRVTRIGRILRRTNVDELPQLINILRGDMSLVGPRPALPSQDQLNLLRKKNGALGCTPGLTGLAQVNSFDDMTEYQKCEWDRLYSRRLTLSADLGIVLRTFSYLLKPPPVY